MVPLTWFATSSTPAEPPAAPASGSRRGLRVLEATPRVVEPSRVSRAGAAFAAVVMVGSLVACDLTPTPGPDPSQSPSQTPSPSPRRDDAALEAAQELTVRVENVTCGAEIHVGSGFLISPDYAVTAYHVVEGAREPVAVRPSFAHSDSSISSGTVVGWDPTNDVALIHLKRRLDNTGRGIEFADDPASGGDRVHEIGYPALRS